MRIKFLAIFGLLFLFFLIISPEFASADTASFRIYDNTTSYHRRIIEPNNGDNSSHASIYQENEIATLYKWDTASLSGQCISSASINVNVSLFQGVNFGDTNYRWSIKRLLRDFTTSATWNTYDGIHNWTTPGGRGDGDIASTYANNDIIYNFNNGYINFNLDTAEITTMITENKGLIFALPEYTSGTHYITFGQPVLNVTYGACQAPPPTLKTPVILIPEIMGSEFEVTEDINNSGIKQCTNPLVDYEYKKGDTVWLNQAPLTILENKICGRYLDILKMDESGNEVYSQVGLKGTLVNNILGNPFAYQEILNFFQNEKNYQLNKDFFIFPYDWRKDIKDNITALNDKINTATKSAGINKVQIIAHSMGGLIARDYIRDPQRAQKVDTLVELGTPHAGTPTFLAHLLYNKCIKIFDLACVINGNEVNKLVQNYPGAFELLPDKLYYQLYPDSRDYPFKDSRDVDGNGVKGELNYDQTKTLLSNLGKNMPLFDIAESYHDALDGSYNTSDYFDTDTNGVKTFMIAGSGKPTIGQIHDYYGFTTFWGDRVELPFGVPKLDADATNGDDTVPLLSATLGKLSHVYYVNQSHSDLPTGAALQMTYNLLNGQADYISGVLPAPSYFNGKIISVHSPVILQAYDNNGRHTGVKDDGAIELGIPGSSYDEFGESKFIYLPNGGTYNIKTKATGEGSFDLKIKSYTESTLSKEQLYLNVPQTTETTTTMTLDSDSPTLHVDTDNNGTVDHDISPSSILTGDNLADIQAPITTAQKEGTQGTGDWYTSDVALTFTPEDTGSGILNTYYYKDGEHTLHEGSSITLSNEGTTKVWYFSVDKAGNTEQPQSITIKIDKTAPIITYNGRTQANTDGWNNSNVTLNWTCTDEVSGVVDAALGTTITTEGQNQSAKGTCTDNAGNNSTDTQSGINIDKTAPAISNITPSNNASYILKSMINADWNVSDNLSGVASQSSTVATGSPLDTNKIGTYNFSVTSTDKAGNTSSQTITYKIIYRFDGFLQPINDTGHEQTCGVNCTVSIFKGGSAVPIKFQIKDANGSVIQSATAPQWINPKQGNAIADNVNESDFTDATDSGSVYSWDGTQYHYNWKTKDIPSGNYWLIGVMLDDGQTYTVNVGLR